MSSPASSDRISPQLIGAITATAILAFLGLFLETVLNVLFPALMSDFSVTMDDVQWMTSGYLLVVSIVMPITGWLQRRFMPRSLFFTAAGSILTGALVAALAPTYPLLLADRLIQGMGTGIVTPLMFTIILTRSPRSKIGALMGVALSSWAPHLPSARFWAASSGRSRPGARCFGSARRSFLCPYASARPPSPAVKCRVSRSISCRLPSSR